MPIRAAYVGNAALLTGRCLGDGGLLKSARKSAAIVGGKQQERATLIGKEVSANYLATRRIFKMSGVLEKRTVEAHTRFASGWN